MTMYFLIRHSNPDTVWATPDRDEALNEAMDHVRQYICQFMRHELPMKVAYEEIRRFDIRLVEMNDRPHGSFGVAACTEVELPFQMWVDIYYEEMMADEAHEADLDERDYEQYKRLHVKFEERFLAETTHRTKETLDHVKPGHASCIRSQPS